MATTATAAPGKTSFVKEFLQGNPQANAKAVNEAWTAAEMKGTISHPVISEVRKQLGLTGNLPGKTRNAAKEKAASNMPRTATVTPGKTMFVKEFLNDHPQGNTKDVNEAWQAAGFEGTISPTLVNKTRVKLTGKRRGYSKTAAKGKAAANKPKTVTATPGKTNFVKEFLQGNPQANAKAVNEAWTAAGMKGTISHPVISEVRKQLGLTGNLPGKTRNAAKEKAASNMSRTATVTPGKTMFVKEFLNDHPQGNTKDVNEAWQA